MEDKRGEKKGTTIQGIQSLKKEEEKNPIYFWG